MSSRLSKRAEQLFIDDILIPEWDPSGALGFDLTASPGDDAFLPVATSIDNVGAVYPSLVITYSNETSGGGETSYDFVTTNGPGQNRNGQLIATARAEDIEDGYTGDPGTYSAEDADVVVSTLIAEVEDVCLRRAENTQTDFSYVGSERGPDVPDDTDPTPVVRMDSCEISYGWDRRP